METTTMIQTGQTSPQEIGQTAPTTLEELLEPFSLSDFFDLFGENFIYVPGVEGKFSGLFPWEVLNTVLRQHRLHHPRLRVFRNGELVPSSKYLKTNTGRKSRSTVSRMMPAELISQLQKGATLVVDAVDELYDPLTDLAAALELVFKEHIQVNLYAGWHTSPGFNVHWDDHDVLILQLSGRKAWAVYGETRKHPLANDVVKDKTPPEKPIWEATISDGDLLYLPRGFWHVATPLDEPSLHLTFGIPNRTGVDLFTWFARQLRNEEIFRKDLPKFKSDEDRKAHYEHLFNTAKQRFTDDLIAEYWTEHDGNASPRIRLNLPDIASKNYIDNLLDRSFILATPRKLKVATNGNSLVIKANKKEFRFPVEARAVLETLDHRKPTSMADLVEAAAGTIDATGVSSLLKKLLTDGIITALPPAK